MKDTNKSTNVLVTGGTGFLAGWTIRKLFRKRLFRTHNRTIDEKK